MAAQKAPFKLVVKEVVFIKPSKLTPSSILSLSTLDSIPDHNFLCQTIHVYRSTIHDSVPFCPNGPQILDDPTQMVFHSWKPMQVATFPLSITWIALIAKHLVFDLPSQDQNEHLFPLVFKVRKFPCGGFTIGMGLSHAVCDGVGASQFFRAIIELARGKNEPSVKPVWERERLVGSITKQPLQIDFVDEASAAVSPFFPTKF
ncbi:hypothetical protein VNO78_27955 [Psophocarpus tetragonolobus]|uniref:Uncharacterized protein n=1 Tax=Psophocarpus tetragonolobus TaxID=3891 RepID=A0AAN9S169_PSOTE